MIKNNIYMLIMPVFVCLAFQRSASTDTIYASTESISKTVTDTPFVKVPHKKFEFSCDVCHTTDSWKVMKSTIEFDHSRTGFALRGSHERTHCQGCHAGGKFNASVRECAVCHKDIHQGELGPDCERCHNEDAWAPSTFNHNDQTFLMIGGHRGLDCADCHRNLMTYKIPNVNQCSDCHTAIGASPQHAQWVANSGGEDCLACHSMNSWNDYPHLDQWFSLVGHHRQSCETCHKNIPDYTTYTCRNCHDFDHKGDGGGD